MIVVMRVVLIFVLANIVSSTFADTVWFPTRTEFDTNDQVVCLIMWDHDSNSGTPSRIVAGGSFTGVTDDANVTRVAWWDEGDAIWRRMGDVDGNGAVDMGNEDGDLGGLVRALFVYKGDLYAGGSFTSADGNSVKRVAKWTGTEWAQVGSGANHDVYCFGVYKGDLYMGGRFNQLGDVATTMNRIARWGGSDWVSVGNGITQPSDRAIVRAMTEWDDRLIVAGDISQATDADSDIVGGDFFFGWNGSDWSNVGMAWSFDSVTALHEPDGPRSLAVLNGVLYAGGELTANSNVDRINVVSLSGPSNSWQAVEGLNQFGEDVSDVNVVFVWRGSIVAGGTFDSVDPDGMGVYQLANSVAQLNSSTGWDPLINTGTSPGAETGLTGNGTTETVHGEAFAFTSECGDLIVGGDFIEAQGSTSVNWAFFGYVDTFSCDGDADGDGAVDFQDLNIVNAAFNTDCSDPAYDKRADMNEDRLVNFTDLNMVLTDYNTTCPP